MVEILGLLLGGDPGEGREWLAAGMAWGKEGGRYFYGSFAPAPPPPPTHGPLTWGEGDCAAPRTPTTPPPPLPLLGASGQQLVAKGVALRHPWAATAPDAQ